nr:immunoglobulin light chain junction region [Macaca mulatta]
CLQGYSPPYRF